MAKSGSRCVFCRAYLDWSERRYHIAAHVGADILLRLLEHYWLVRTSHSRVLRLMPAARRGLH